METIKQVNDIKYEDPSILINKCSEYISNIDDELKSEMLGLLQDCEKKEYTCAYERLVQIDILNAIRDTLFDMRKDARVEKL